MSLHERRDICVESERTATSERNFQLCEGKHGARQQTTLLVYQRSIQTAFRSVSDALVAYRKTREFRTQEEFLFRSAQDAARLSHMRYTGGVTGYLEVLTNETNAFSAELAVVQARQNELLALVHLYEALGGGWQQ
jgi:outer membrane protein, multidrug efflux system